jgi:predicted DCC family thiol-disulfide oxidoreductase YuxK
MIPSPASPRQSNPILLFDDECGVCRRIAGWVTKSAQQESGKMSLVVRPIGHDPEALRVLNPALDIWEAYATIHVVMPDGSMKRGGEAVAEVLRELPNTSGLARSFAISVLGFRPFQAILNLAYLILADVRPLFGCESCGTSSRWVRSIKWLMKWPKLVFRGAHQPSMSAHFTALAKAARPK